MIDIATRLVNQIYVFSHWIVVNVVVIEFGEEIAEIAEDTYAFGCDDIKINTRLIDDLTSELNELSSLDEIQVFFLNLETLSHVASKALQTFINVFNSFNTWQKVHFLLLWLIHCNQTHVCRVASVWHTIHIYITNI